jgi:hypothetical protein
MTAWLLLIAVAYLILKADRYVWRTPWPTAPMKPTASWVIVRPTSAKAVTVTVARAPKVERHIAPTVLEDEAHSDTLKALRRLGFSLSAAKDQVETGTSLARAITASIRKG